MSSVTEFISDLHYIHSENPTNKYDTPGSDNIIVNQSNTTAGGTDRYG